MRLDISLFKPQYAYKGKKASTKLTFFGRSLLMTPLGNRKWTERQCHEVTWPSSIFNLLLAVFSDKTGCREISVSAAKCSSKWATCSLTDSQTAVWSGTHSGYLSFLFFFTENVVSENKAESGHKTQIISWRILKHSELTEDSHRSIEEILIIAILSEQNVPHD